VSKTGFNYPPVCLVLIKKKQNILNILGAEKTALSVLILFMSDTDLLPIQGKKILINIWKRFCVREESMKLKKDKLTFFS